MKIFAILVLIFSAIIFPQQNNTESILKLEHAVSNSTNYSTEYQENLILEEQIQKKSGGLAILYSLLLPGMGELYADAYYSGKYFTIAEGVLVATFIGMSVYANNQEDNYKAYATSNASVNTIGKDETYYATISEFEDPLIAQWHGVTRLDGGRIDIPAILEQAPAEGQRDLIGDTKKLRSLIGVPQTRFKDGLSAMLSAT